MPREEVDSHFSEIGKPERPALARKRAPAALGTRHLSERVRFAIHSPAPLGIVSLLRHCSRIAGEAFEPVGELVLP